MSPTASKVLCSPPSFVQRPIFPSLREIGPTSGRFSLSLRSSQDIATLSLFIGSSQLVSVNVVVSTFRGCGNALVDTFYPLLRNFSNLNLTFGRPSIEVPLELQPISELNSLRELIYGGSMNRDLLTAIGYLPKLRKLRIAGFNIGPDDTSGPTEGWLTRLEELRIETMSVWGVKMLLCYPIPALKAVKGKAETAECLRELLARAANPGATLGELMIRVPGITLQYADLYGIMHHDNLQYLQIGDSLYVNLDDEQLGTIIKCLPRLLHFSLYPSLTNRRLQNDTNTQLTLLSLQNILHYCPVIGHIEIEFDATDIPKFSVPFALQDCSVRMETLTLFAGCLRVLDPEGVAAWLVELVTSFEHVRLGSLRIYNDDWPEVANIFLTLRKEKRSSLVGSIGARIE